MIGSNDRICLTQENVDIVGDEYRFQRRDRKYGDEFYCS